MKRVISLLLCLCLVMSAAYCETYTVNTIEGTQNIELDDTWFYDSAYNYNHELMRACLRLSMTGWGTSDNYGLDGEFDRERTSRAAAEALGLTGFEAFNFGVSLNSIASYSAYWLGYRLLSDGTALVMAVARCYDYGCGFADNFNIGTDGTHTGFTTAGTEMAYAVRDYIARNLTGRSVKIVLTGYSRAAAVTNTCAKQLDDLAAAGEVSCAPEDIFAYAFAVPTTVLKGASGEGEALYDNIFSVINYFDIVPEAPLTAWGFTRYGRTLTFGKSDTVPESVEKSYALLTGKTIDISGKRDKIDDVLNSLLSKVPTLEDFCAEWQELFIQYVRCTYTEVNADSIDAALITQIREKYSKTVWGSYVLGKYDALTQDWTADAVLAVLMLYGEDGLAALRESATVAALGKMGGNTTYASLLSYLAVARLTAESVSDATASNAVVLRLKYLPMLTVFAGFMECFAGHDFAYYISYLTTLSETEAFG